jgi:hypothetical protein
MMRFSVAAYSRGPKRSKDNLAKMAHGTFDIQHFPGNGCQASVGFSDAQDALVSLKPMDGREATARSFVGRLCPEGYWLLVLTKNPTLCARQSWQ